MIQTTLYKEEQKQNLSGLSSQNERDKHAH